MQFHNRPYHHQTHSQQHYHGNQMYHQPHFPVMHHHQQPYQAQQYQPQQPQYNPQYNHESIKNFTLKWCDYNFMNMIIRIMLKLFKSILHRLNSGRCVRSWVHLSNFLFCRLHHLKRTQQIFIYAHQSSWIVELSTIIRSREYRYQFSLCEKLVSLFNYLMCSTN